MKKMLPYLVVFLLASGAAAVIVAVLLLAKPELLPVAPAPPPDSLLTASRKAPAMGTPVSRDSVAAPADTVIQKPQGVVHTAEAKTVALVPEQKNSALPAEPLRNTMDSTLKAVAAADSVQAEQRKSMAKVLEAMDPTSAARILNDFPDGDVKQIILTIKRRQAAKILAALDPDRAARIMR